MAMESQEQELKQGEQPGEEEYIERDARLLVAGDYPDKGVSISESDLEQMAQQGESVPLLAEHQHSLVLGLVNTLRRVGNELWARVRYPRWLQALIDHNRLRGVSVGLDRNRKQLIEVSLTANPRIADARLFTSSSQVQSDDFIADDLVLYQYSEENDMTETPDTKIRLEQPVERTEIEQAVRSETEPSQESTDAQRQIAEMKARLERAEQNAKIAFAQLFAQSVDRQIDQWVADGRIVPAAVEPLKQLIFALQPGEFSQAIQFSREEGAPLAYRALYEFVDALPVHPTRKSAVRFMSPGQPDPSVAREELEDQLRRLGFTQQVSDTAVNAYLAMNNGAGGNER